ncbi:hypothetical protein M885DRAFT_600142 [Pelagophyceae sp. CCMP2097]|nr:hypothetical protein M885DRAFT_600142 [Pelagophyceae sp. CCMP2097]
MLRTASLRTASRAAPLRRLARRFAVAWDAHVTPRLADALSDLTGVGVGRPIKDVPNNRRATFQDLILSAIEADRITQDMESQWHEVCTGGFVLPREDLVSQHAYAGENLLKMERLKTEARESIITVSDSTSESNLCEASIESLRPIYIPELEVDKVHEGRVLWATLALPATKVASILTVVEDEYGSAATLQLNNFVGADSKCSEVEKRFPKGRSLAIKHPYYRVGTRGLRELVCDNPCNVIWANAEKAAPRPKAGNVVGPVDVALIDGKMRGLVTKRAVLRGEVLIRESALAISASSKRQQIMIAGDGRTWTGSKVYLLPALVSALNDDPLLRARLACLYDGNPRSDVPDVELFSDSAYVLDQDVPQISAARAARIIGLNGFGGDDGDGCAALFALSSFMNHSPTSLVNTDRVIRDGIITVTARGNMPAGTELTMFYFEDDGSQSAALADVRAHYGIPEPGKPLVASQPLESRPGAAQSVRSEPIFADAPPAVPRADQLFTSSPGDKAVPPP